MNGNYVLARPTKQCIAVGGVSNALSQLATTYPFGEKVRGHVGIAYLADFDEAVVHPLHLDDILLKEGLAAVGRGEMVEHLSVRERVTSKECGALGRSAHADFDLAGVEDDIGGAVVGV